MCFASTVVVRVALQMIAAQIAKIGPMRGGEEVIAYHEKLAIQQEKEKERKAVFLSLPPLFRIFNTQCYAMFLLNITPDSFDNAVTMMDGTSDVCTTTSVVTLLVNGET